MSIDDELAALRHSELFEGYDRARLKLIAMTGDRVSFRKGETLLMAGQEPDCVFVLLSGSVSAGGGANLRVLVGAVGLFLRRPLPVAFVAETDVEALRLDRASFLEILRTCSETSLAVITELCRVIDLISRHSVREPTASKNLDGYDAAYKN
ncbi:Cyclic nucleotide-binding domain [Rhabdaerophilaceae bacterium]